MAESFKAAAAAAVAVAYLFVRLAVGLWAVSPRAGLMRRPAGQLPFCAIHSANLLEMSSALIWFSDNGLRAEECKLK